MCAHLPDRVLDIGSHVGDHVRLVTFMHYDLGCFDDEAGRVERIESPFGPKVLAM